MSRDEITVKVLKRVLPIMSILTVFVFVMLINKKSYALFHKRIETDIIIHISTADKMPVQLPESAKKVYDNAVSKECNPIIEDEDGTIYFSGDNECIDFNYVWYSGKLWRITSINSDGTMKMITQDTITTIFWGANTNYKNSWIYQWLNEDFKDTLYNYENIIVQDSDWNATRDEKDTPIKPPTDASADIVTGDVGALNAYEYYQSYKNISGSRNYVNGYLNIKYFWWLITPYSGSNIRDVSSFGNYGNTSAISGSGYGVRPSVNLKSDIQLSGEGSKTNPYKITGDKETGKTGELINTRTSGEYVSVDNKVYRIVGIEDGATKLTSVDYVRDNEGTILTKNFGSSTSWGTSISSENENYWDYYLNNTWLKTAIPNYIDILEKGTYYLGQYSKNVSYKNTICSTSNTSESTKSCAKTSSTWQGLVGLPRVGEMFSAQLIDTRNFSNEKFMWLITPSDNSSYVRNISTSSMFGASDDIIKYTNVVRPSINLKSGVKITSGDGKTPETAYEIGL